MARTIGKLTALAVAKAGPGYLSDGGGLYLRVGSGGARSWVFRYRVAGKLHEMGLGPLHTVSLAEARDTALAQRKLRLDGADPILTRKAVRVAARLADATSVTFRQAGERYIDAHRPGWKNAKHAAQWASTLETYIYPLLGRLPVQAVDTALVMKAIEPLWQTRPETASRVRGRVEAILDWAKARGFRQGENPARWRGHLENLLPARRKVSRIEHHAAMLYTEIAHFVAELRRQEGVAAARALEFTILTAGRTGEVIGARWSEIDLEARLWTISAERMKKAGREHRVPLSEPALAVLRPFAEAGIGEYVFPGNRAGRPLSQMAMLMLLRRMGRDGLTVHGFRSSFRDWAAERTGFPAEVAEMALAHAVGDKVEAAYRRGDLFQKRRQLAEAWAKFCAAPPLAGKVVPMRGPAPAT